MLVLMINFSAVLAEEDLNRIYDFVREEVMNRDKFSELGWWQIENRLKNEFDIIIPTKILENVQKYYVRALIDKNLKKYSNFTNFVKIYKIPKNVLNYGKRYFNDQKKRLKKNQGTKSVSSANINRKVNEYSFVRPEVKIPEDTSAVIKLPEIQKNEFENYHNKNSNSKVLIEPLNLEAYDTFIKSGFYSEQTGTDDEFEKKLDAFNKSLQNFKEQSDKSEKEFTVKKVDPKLFENPSLEKANRIFSEIKQSIDKNEYNDLEARVRTTIDKTSENMGSDKIENNDLNLLKKDLELAMEQITNLNDGIKNFLSQVDSRYDAKLQAALKENQRLSQQLDNANKLASTLKEHLLKKLDESYKQNSVLNKKNLSLADNMIELSDILKEYQNQNAELTELLRKSVNEIERLRNENKQLLVKLNVEFEELKKENKILKERLDIQTQSISAPRTEFNLEFKNRAVQTLK